MSALIADVRVGLRLLWRDKAFTSTAGVTLAVCIAANAALFSIVHAVVLKPLAIPEPDRVIVAGNVYPGAGVNTPIGTAVPDYFDRLRATTVFQEQALFRQLDRSIDESGTPARVEAVSVTPSFFRLIGVPAAVGRTFNEAEGEPGNERVVVLSYGFWQSQYGGDSSAVGRDLRVDGRQHRIVGVMPRGYRPLDEDTLLWLPLAFSAQDKSDDRRHSNDSAYLARLQAGATLQQAQSQIDALNATNLDRFPQFKEVIVNAKFRTVVQGLQDRMVEDVRPSLYLMWGGAVFVLLIGCVNVANLVLARSRARLRELATRLALGAGTWRIARQLTIEHVLLTLASALAGLAIGDAALRGLETISLQDLPRASEIRLDAVVAAYTFAVAAIIGLALGLMPVAAARAANILGILREEGRGGTSSRGARSLRRGLVVAQVACAFVLLIGSGLLFASFRKVLTVDPGFRTEGVLTAAVSLPNARYADDDAVRRFTTEALTRVRALPGVTAAGASDSIPFGNSMSASAILAEGYEIKPGESLIAPNEVRVSDGYFDAIGARLVAGRFFDDRDRATSTRVIVIDDRLARRFWPGQDPIGRRLYRPTDDADDPQTITDKTVFLTVVGVIREMKLRSLTDGENVVGAYYLPLSQEPQSSFTFTLRTAADPASLSNALRREITAMDGQLPVFEMQPMRYWTERALATRRSPALLSVGFGAVALFLSAIGLYGVLAYVVTQRTREIGIRVALGSPAAWIFQLVLREGLLLVGAGLILGGAGSLLLGKALESQLFGVTTTDPFVLSLVSLVLATVAIAACAVPARRATRIDPLIALTQ
jgi:predicted permease